ncbi:hypothetical protein [Chelativorans sp. Marseille-P2723]|uniref:baeRF3 domain-containing protein n=1 Tax=Chelativorans sp. Marseille-P2723 TaxID=2709133 RepID=UPI00156F76D2|nr:hypothetical protein [Chelativorans sp. Marseille-P2723]
MDALERDYRTVLLADHEPPCLSLYQPTFRSFPDRQQNKTRFRNLVKELEQSLRQKYSDRESEPLLRPFHELTEDTEFWHHPRDGLAIFATVDIFKVYRLQRLVGEMAIAANSFHAKPLMRILQSADRYHILGLNREEVRLFEGNRYALDEVETGPGFPRTSDEVVKGRDDDPEQRNRAYGPAGQNVQHGTDSRQAFLDAQMEQFFRMVDEAVLEEYSQPSKMPLLLAALPEQQPLFRSVSNNPYLIETGLDVHPSALSIEELRERAWQLVLPIYLNRLGRLVEQFGASRSEERGSADVAEIARAVVAGRVETLLVDADRVVPGRFDPDTGAIEFAKLDEPGVDDLLDDLGEHTLKTGGEVVIVPAERMPTDTGLAAIYRF